MIQPPSGDGGRGDWPAGAEIKRPPRRGATPPAARPDSAREAPGQREPYPAPDPYAQPHPIPQPYPLGSTSTVAGGPGGISSRMMALTGTSLIAVLAVLVFFAGGLPGLGSSSGSGLGGAVKSPSETANTGSPGGGSSCVAVTGDLLCQAKAQANSTAVVGTDVDITVTGPGSVTLADPRLMIDGRLGTVWTSSGEATGAQITVQFKYPVTVGTVGLAVGSADASTTGAGRRVLAATWSFAPATEVASGYCGLVPGAFGSPVTQDFPDTATSSATSTQKVTPPVRTCAVRVHLDRLSRVTGSGGGSIAISELTLLAP